MPDGPAVRVTAVDGDGVRVESVEDTVLDVLFDGRRIWSFWTLRDSVDGVAPWPPQLRKFLDGSTRLAVVEHVSGRTVLDEERSFGAGDRADRRRRRRGSRARHRQVQPAGEDLRHP